MCFIFKSCWRTESWIQSRMRFMSTNQILREFPLKPSVWLRGGKLYLESQSCSLWSMRHHFRQLFTQQTQCCLPVSQVMGGDWHCAFQFRVSWIEAIVYLQVEVKTCYVISIRGEAKTRDCLMCSQQPELQTNSSWILNPALHSECWWVVEQAFGL